MTQPGLFDIPAEDRCDAHGRPLPCFDCAAAQAREEGKRRRDRSMDQVEENAPEGWNDAALAAVRTVAKARATFTTDHLLPHVRKPREPRAFGPVMRRATRAGLCAPTDRMATSSDPTCHARPKRVWRSLVHEETT